MATKVPKLVCACAEAAASTAAAVSRGMFRLMVVLLERVAQREAEGEGLALVGAVVVVAVEPLGRARGREDEPGAGVHPPGACLPGAAQGDAVAVGVRQQGRDGLGGGRRLVEE